MRCRVAGLGLLALLSSNLAYAATSSQPKPTVVFSTPGLKPVTLEVCNSAGCSSITRTVTVLDPRPAVTQAAVLTPAVEVGQLAFLNGAGTGKPPLRYSWQIYLGAAPLLTLSGATAYWNTAGFSPGAYTAVLRIENGSGTAESLPQPITLVASRPSDFYTVTPCRVYDSRSSAAIATGTVRTIAVGGSCGVPQAARAVAVNVTVVNATGGGFASIYPGNYPVLATSTINFVSTATRANNAILPLATDGSGRLSIYVSMGGGGSAHVIVDVSGYFLPEELP